MKKQNQQLNLLIEDDEKYIFSEKALKFIKKNNYDYITGLLEFCNQESIETDEITYLISDKFYSLLQKEAIENNMIKKTIVL